MIPPWIERLSRAGLLLHRWIGRFYATFFLALGVLFLYWSGRGLFGYATGIRAAWSEPLACGAGLVAAVLSLWVGARLVRSGLPSSSFGRSRGLSPELEATIDEAMRLEETDPVAARQLLDSYFMREATAAERRRAELRERAAHDLKAALALRRELQEEGSSNTLVRKEVLASVPEGQRTSMLAEVDAVDQRLRSELLQLDGAIERLKLQ